MKKFFEEYGFIILICVVIISLIGITIGIKPLMADSLSDITNTWGLKAKDSLKFNNSENEQSIVYTSDVGKYYSEDGNQINGIIFVDLAADGKETNPKQYETSLNYGYLDGYNGIFGTREVITPVKGTTGNDRYYVMFTADSDLYSWYFNAKKTGISDTTLTSTDLGSGKQNTTNMINTWDNETYGKKDLDDEFDNYTYTAPTGTDTIVFNSGIEKIMDSEYSDKTKYGGQVIIPNTVTSIGSYAFYNCSGLQSITIPSSVKYIGGYAFAGVSGITSIDIPENSITSIKKGTFMNCTNLRSVYIPSSVTSIDENVFAGCSNLTIYTDASSKLEGWSSTFNKSGNGEIPVVYNCSKENYNDIVNKSYDTEVVDMWSDAKQCITAGIDSVFIPSRDEWTTFIKVIGANNTNYSSMGLSQYYWTSSLSDDNHAYAINFENNTFIESDYGIGSFLPVRFASKE